MYAFASGQRDVCFTPKSGHWLIVSGCPLWVKSGHQGYVTGYPQKWTLIERLGMSACAIGGSWHDPRNVSYSDEGCQPTFFNVIPERSNVDQRPKFTARISRTTPFAFLSRAVLARLTNAASGSAPLYVPRISATLRKLDVVPIKSIVEAQILPILVPPTPNPYF